MENNLLSFLITLFFSVIFSYIYLAGKKFIERYIELIAEDLYHKRRK